MISRQFVTLGDQQVHLRRAGDGPPILLLHDLPNSSRLLEPTLTALAAAGFTALAPDLPGYGNSDPLAGEASIGACVEVINQLTDALGIACYGLYGGHTGAVVAAELAVRNPERVAALVLNGYPLFDAEERIDYQKNFFRSAEISWDGGHLAWLWARMREQMIFFPWHSPGAANRLSYDIPPPEVLQGRALDWLRGIDGHAGIYKAVFNHDPAPALARLPMGSVVAYWDLDVLAAHRHRLPALPPGSRLEIVEGGDRFAITGKLPEWLAGARALPPAPPARPAAAIDGRLIQDFVDTPAGQVAVRRVAGPGRPYLLLHDAGGSSALLADLAASLGENRAVLAPDLPGHGESPAPSVQTLEGYLAPLLALLDNGPVDILGFGAGAALGVELALRRPDKVSSLVLSGLAPLPEALVEALASEGALSLAPRWDGGHLLTAWHRIRDGALFWPWFRRGRAGIRKGEPRLEPLHLQKKVTELMKAAAGYGGAWDLWARYPTAGRVAALAKAPVVLTSAHDPLLPYVEAWTGADVRRVQDPPKAWAAVLLALRPH